VASEPDPAETAATEPTVRANPQTAESTPRVLAERYVLLRQIGAGGMGTVYAGYDRELDRTVAIKLLDALAAEKLESRTRMQREAQAMARVSSPHVVTVHDVGAHDGQIYIAMELLGGGTLRTWLRDKPRSWREIARVFEAAGRGLAAAHERGLIHRDFKPDNVLIDGDKIRVGDFGVAAALGSAPRPPRPELGSGPSSLDQEITAAGVVVGTPAYMSPEQLAGETVDARSDQFSYCVALYEALAGRRPFVAESPSQLAHEMRTNPPRGVGRAPSWLRALVLRGLALDPTERFPSMDALLRALGRGRTRMRRRLFVGAIVALVALLALFVLVVDRRLAADEPCATLAPPPPIDLGGLDRRLVALRTDGQLAADHVARRLAAWRDEVATLRRSSCQASRVEGRESAQLFDLRMECIARSSRDVGALVTAFGKPTPELADNAVAAVERVTNLARCRGPRAQLEGIGPEPPSAGPLRERLAATIADELSGRSDAAYKSAVAIAGEAARLHLPALEADAWRIAGEAREEQGEMVAAAEAWQHALIAVEATTDTHMRALLYLDLARSDMFLDRFDDAKRWVKQAHALVERTEDNSLRWSVTQHEGDVAYYEDKFSDAVALYRRALSEHEKLGGGGQTIDDGQMLAVLGDTLQEGPATPEAEALLRRAITIIETRVGAHHPMLVAPLVGLVEATENEGEALELAKRAFAIAEATPGPGTKYSEAARALASVLERTGDAAHARAVLDEAIQRHPAPNTSSFASLVSWRGTTYRNEGKLAEALADGERAVAVIRSRMGPRTHVLPAFEIDLAETQRAMRRFDDARATLADAAAIAEAGGNERPILHWIELQRALIELDDGKPDSALSHAERAFALTEHSNSAHERATGQLVLARTLAALHRDRERAVALIRAAKETFEHNEDDSRLADVAKVYALLGLR